MRLSICLIPRVLNIIDIAQSSIAKNLRKKFKTSIKNEKRIQKAFSSPDSTFYIEIKQPEEK